ncbi:helix-turn-helix domain-containing protein [Stenotrophomonas pavanii]|uniref:helix-turn-helix domain-containing protein n=1 Tax=Stenotrophomonas pavanii TaxID=487698 RepID=UPI002894B558|nr:helix-turn-helix domain-containing protein [Stenotrophomonas pavanii]MDT3530253.1 helix-turn-helix domain-containing protein [Stenotrophomonas pavanii]
MSHDAMNWAVQQRLGAKQKLLLIMLAFHAARETHCCSLSRRKLSVLCGMSIDSVKRALPELVAMDLISVEFRGDEGTNLPNAYTLKVGEPA